MGDILLNEWGNIWTQKLGQDMATNMWEKMRQLIITSRSIGNDIDTMTTEDVLRCIRMINSGTAVGID